MSFELFLQSFSHGDASGIPIQAIRESFGSALSEPEDDFWLVDYGAAQSSDLFLNPLPDQPSLIHNISIHRPCTDARLYEALWQLLGLPGTLLYFPGGTVPLARDGAIGVAMPPDMLEALGEPAMIRSAADILLAIESS
jgi:hypothetical protein